MFEEKNKKLLADNQEYVKQMISMKESRAELMNDCLSGKFTTEVSTVPQKSYQIFDLLL